LIELQIIVPISGSLLDPLSQLIVSGPGKSGRKAAVANLAVQDVVLPDSQSLWSQGFDAL
jgi:hypothetical protein